LVDYIHFYIISSHYLGRLQVILSFPTRRSSALALLFAGHDLAAALRPQNDPFNRLLKVGVVDGLFALAACKDSRFIDHVFDVRRSEEHTSELQSRENLVCRLLLANKNTVKHTKD